MTHQAEIQSTYKTINKPTMTGNVVWCGEKEESRHFERSQNSANEIPESGLTGMDISGDEMKVTPVTSGKMD